MRKTPGVIVFVLLVALLLASCTDGVAEEEQARQTPASQNAVSEQTIPTSSREGECQLQKVIENHGLEEAKNLVREYGLEQIRSIGAALEPDKAEGRPGGRTFEEFLAERGYEECSPEEVAAYSKRVPE